MKHITLNAEILQSHILLFDHSRGGFRVKAMVCPVEGRFKAFVWDGDGKSSNLLPADMSRIPSLDGFKPIHEGTLDTVLRCFMVIEAYFKKAGKRLCIHIFNMHRQKDEVKRLGLIENVTDNGFFYADKTIIESSNAVPFKVKCRIALDNLKGQLTAKKTPPLTIEELNAFSDIMGEV